MADHLPHTDVMTRLGVSAIHGIGVFAIRRIPAGSDVFPNDRREIVWVPAGPVDALPADSAVSRLYIDFGIRRGDRIGCPPSFDLLGTGWYVNAPPPNVAASLIATADYTLVAARDIAAGEELTVDYASFSDTGQT